MEQTFYFSVLTALSPNGMDSGFVATRGGIEHARILIRAYYPNSIIIELIFAHNGGLA